MNTNSLLTALEDLKLMLLQAKGGFTVPERYEPTLDYVKTHIDVPAECGNTSVVTRTEHSTSVGSNTIDNPEEFIEFITSQQLKCR